MAAGRIRTWHPEDSTPAPKKAAPPAPESEKAPAPKAPAATKKEKLSQHERDMQAHQQKVVEKTKANAKRLKTFRDIVAWAREQDIWSDPNPYVVFVNYCVDEKPEWLDAVLTDQWLRPVLSRYFNPNADLGPEYRV